MNKGADESRWAPRTSNPLGGIKSVFGGFDSHALPPLLFLTLYNSPDSRFQAQ